MPCADNIDRVPEIPAAAMLPRHETAAVRVPGRRRWYNRRRGQEEPTRGWVATSLLSHLMVLVGVLTLPLILLAAAALALQFRVQHAQAEASLIDQAKLIAHVVDSTLRRAEQVAQTISGSVAVASGDRDAIGAEIAGAATTLSGDFSADGELSEIVVTDAHGQPLADSVAPDRRRYRPLPPVTAAIAAGRPTLSDLVVSKPSEESFVAAIVPVHGSQGIGAVVVLLPGRRLIDVTELSPSGNTVVSMEDRGGVTVFRSVLNTAAVGKRRAPAVLMRAELAADSGGVAAPGTLNFERVPSLVAFAHAPYSGFIVTVSVPESLLFAPLWSSLRDTALLGLGIVVLGLGTTIYLVRRILRAFNQAIPPADRNALLVPAATGLREADQLAATFRAMLIEREAATNQMQRLDATARTLFERSPVGVVVSDADGRVISANDAFLTILGRDRADLDAGRLDWEAITPSEWKPLDEAARVEAAASGNFPPYEKEYLRPDGTRVPVLIFFGLIDQAAGLAATFAVDLSDRRAAEVALQQTEECYRALASATREGIVIREKGRIVEVNDAYWRMFGYTCREDVIGRNCAELLAPEARADVAARIRGGVVEPFESLGLRADGSTFTVEFQGYPIQYRGRQMRVAIARDLTQQKMAEQALRASEERYRALSSATREGVLIHENGRIVEANDAYLRIFGYTSRDALIGRKTEEVVAPDAWPEVRENIRQGWTERYESVGMRADGTTFPVELQAHPVEYHGRQMRAAFVRDLTQQKAAEAALSESEASFRALADSMPQLFWSARGDGYKDYCNARFYDFSGWPPGTAAETRWKDLVHPDDVRALRERWFHSLRSGEPYEVECRLRRHDGVYRWMLVRAMPIRQASASAVLRWFGSCTDITDIVEAREISARSRVELEALVEERTQALQEAERRLAHAERTRALGQLAGGIAHDFNNVLQAVQGGCAMIERRPEKPHEVRRLASLVLNAAERGAAITHRLLAFSRRADLRAEAVDAGLLLDAMRDILVHTLGAGIDIRLIVPPGLPALHADKGQLETVLINLATNARDAMGGRGTLTLSAERVEWLPGQRGPHNLTMMPGHYVSLVVTDTGSGMDAATLARVTEPFFTTKPQGKGTGLGLAMARGFAEQSGGGLTIESAPGHGTTVSLYLPISAASPGASDSDDGEVHPRFRVKTVRLLLVDDDAVVREVVGNQMRAAGLLVSAFESGAAALAHLDAGAAVDVLISDLSMPKMDGLTLIQQVKERRPGLPAVLLTGAPTGAAAIAGECASSGDFRLLRKPIDGKALTERVVELLDEGAI